MIELGDVLFNLLIPPVPHWRAVPVNVVVIAHTKRTDADACGVALRFYSSARMRVARKGTLGSKGNEHGICVGVKVMTNKVTPPWQTAEFDVEWGKGANQRISESASQRWIAGGRQPSSTSSGARGSIERATFLTLPW